MQITDARQLYDTHLGLHKAESTRDHYNERLDVMALAFGVPQVHQITLDVVESWLLEACQHYAPSTLNADLSILKAFINWLVRRKHLKGNPLEGLENVVDNRDPKRRALTEDEIAKLIHAPNRGLIWETFISTGLRKMELVNLRRMDIDLDERTVFVRPSTAKGGKSRRVPIVAGLAVRLRQHFNGGAPAAPAFTNSRGNPYYNTLLRALKTDVRRADIEPEGVDLHALRKTFATRLINRGVDPRTVQKWLGHADLRLTMEIYADYVSRQSAGTLAAMEMPS